MNRKIFNAHWAALLVLPNSERVTDTTQEIFWDLLKDIPDDIWEAGVRKYMLSATFFPTPHDLGVACFGERKEEWVDRCDPLRERQNYREKITPISWQEKAAQVFVSRGLTPPTRLLLDSPVNLDAKREENVRLRKALDEIRKLKREIGDLLEQRRGLLLRIEKLEGRGAQAPEPKMTVSERKALLRDQVLRLNASEKAQA